MYTVLNSISQGSNMSLKKPFISMYPSKGGGTRKEWAQCFSPRFSNIQNQE